jgi:fructokinase
LGILPFCFLRSWRDAGYLVNCGLKGRQTMPNIDDQLVIGLGEVLWDCFDEGRRPGGAPANVAFHAQQLGCRAAVCSRVGNDDLGRELVAYLQDRGLDTRLIQRDEARPTGYVTVNTAHRDSPDYVIHEGVAWDAIEFNDDVVNAATKASAVCFGTLAQRTETSRETIHRVLAAAKGAVIVYDVNLRQKWYRREWVERSLKAANLVKLNASEVRMLADVLDLGNREPAHFANTVRERYGVDTTCVTRGADGCSVFAADQTIDVPGVSVNVVDAVGAGDAFTAGLISAILRGWPLRLAASFANRVGALVAGQSGAMPIISDQLRKLVEEVEPDRAD